jgi:nucleotide-binding universal stress UspA family protein
MDHETLRQVEAATQQMLRDELTRAGVEGHALVSAGSSTDEAIVRAASDHGAELVVVGSHGRTGVQRLALGSIAESVLMHAHCSVVAVR